MRQWIGAGRSTASPELRLGALGGPGTFAAQAAERFSSWGPISYFPSAADEWQALADGAIDAFVMLAASSRTGFGDLAKRAARPAFDCYVVAEAQVPYGCLLLARPGTRIRDIRAVLGHGSVEQCQPFLTANLPQAAIVVERTSSLDAAERVARGDGSLAVVGTARTAAQFGLDVLAADIDGGVVGEYWLVSSRRLFAESPNRLMVSGRFGDEGRLSAAIEAMHANGFKLRTALSLPTGQALFEYDYLLALGGKGRLRDVEQAVARFPSMKLIGAFVA